MTNSNNIEQLKKDILEYNRSYREGKPTISDEKFDEYVDELKNQLSSKDYIAFRKTLFESAGDIKHAFPVGSFEKIKNDDHADENLEKFIKNDPEDQTYAITEKIDGSSMTVKYENGILVEALSRGDGLTGTDETNKLALIVPKVIDYKKPITIRGEVTLTFDVFDQVKEACGKDFKNLRNATTGILLDKNPLPDVVRAVSFIAYRVWDCEEELRTLINGSQEREMAFIASQGFLTPPITTVEKKNLTAANLQIIWDHILKSNPNYQVDGLVIQKNGVDNLKERALLPKGGMAYKFNSLVAETTLKDIVWQVSKSGYMCPVGILEPVNLGGSTVSRCTLHNFKNVIDNRLRKNIKIKICKSGDIIPYFVCTSIPKEDRPWDSIEETCKDFLPKKCPACGSKDILIKRDATEIRCMNGTKCVAQSVGKLEFFLRNFDVKGVSEVSLRKWGILSFKDLVDFMDNKNPQGKAQEKFGNEVFDKIFDSKINLQELMANLDWDGIGEKTWKKIFNHISITWLISRFYLWIHNNEEDAHKELVDAMTKIDGIQDATINNIAVEFMDNMAIMQLLCDKCQTFHLREAIECKVNDDSKVCYLKDLTFVITGTLTKPRKEWVKIIEDLGGNVVDKVSSKTDFLVCNDKNSTSSKTQTAKSLYIPIINEKELEEKCHLK